MKLRIRAALALLALGVPLAVRAAVPAPPVNQTLGIPDSVFSALQEADCRRCHNQTPPIAAVDPTYLPDRHHLLVESIQLIPTGTAAPNGTPGERYVCLSCHEEVFNPDTSSFELVQDFRNCLNCHRPMTNEIGIIIGTVHHASPSAQGGNCAVCHGTLVDNGLLDADGDGRPDAARWVPTYRPSLVTPAPSGKPNPGPNGEGNCTFCHSTGAADGAPHIDPASGALVYSSEHTHHATGFGSDPTKCFWCHTTEGGIFGTTMRRCENCHGIPSLHGIQVATNPGSPISPGQELPGYGHIGSQDDCWGCHGFTRPVQALGLSPQSVAATDISLGNLPQTAVVPSISAVNTPSVPAGRPSPILLTGSAFTNEVRNPATGLYDRTLESKAVLTDKAGDRTTLDPAHISPDTLQADLPSSLPKGIYRLTAVKNRQSSNPVMLAVTPAVKIFSAHRTDRTVVIRGGGFGGYLKAADSGLSVKGRLSSGGTALARIVDWSPTRIVAEFSSSVDSVEVAGVFGSSNEPALVTDSAHRATLAERGRLGRVMNLFAGWQIR